MPQLTIVIPACPGCCLFCHDLWGDVLPCVTAGILECGVYTPDAGAHCYLVTIVSGVNGAFDVTWTGSVWENASVGRVSVQEVDCSTEDPIGDPEEVDVNCIVSCDNDVLAVSMGYVSTVDGGSGVFSSSGFIDTSLPNTFHCVGGDRPFGEGSFIASTP